MKVKELIEELLKMPQESEIKIDLRQSTNLIEIDRVERYKTKVFGKEVESIEIIAEWQDFKLDEEEAYFCEKELVEAARPEPEY